MIHVRVTDEMKARLERSAKANGRSMNAEIVQCIESALGGSTILTDAVQQYREETSPQDPEERGLIRVWRALSAAERSAIRAMIDAFVDTRERARGTQRKSKE